MKSKNNFDLFSFFKICLLFMQLIIRILCWLMPSLIIIYTYIYWSWWLNCVDIFSSFTRLITIKNDLLLCRFLIAQIGCCYYPNNEWNRKKKPLTKGKQNMLTHYNNDDHIICSETDGRKQQIFYLLIVWPQPFKYCFSWITCAHEISISTVRMRVCFNVSCFSQFCVV